MATIKQHLNEFEKLIEKQNKSNKQLYEECIKELEEQEKQHNAMGMSKDSKNEKHIALEKAKVILEELIEEEENKRELARIKYDKQIDKNIKEEIKEELFSNLNSYFIKYKDKHEQIKNILLEQDTIEYEIKRITDIYGTEFEDYIYSIYIQTYNKVYGIYKIKVKEQIKQREQAEKQYQKNIKNISNKIYYSVNTSRKTTKNNNLYKQQRINNRIKHNYKVAGTCLGLCAVINKINKGRYF